jgi:DNA repair photolyase
MRKIKGLRAIYEPKGAAREYGALAVNLFNGCTCGCTYCYVPRMPGFPSREVFRAAATLRRPDILDLIERDAVALQAQGNTEPVFLCFTCDPCEPGLVDYTSRAICSLKLYGQRVTLLTKRPSQLYDAPEILRNLARSGSALGVTLTLLDKWRAWEPGADNPLRRMTDLCRAHERGIRTMVSLEPVLDPAQAMEIIRLTAPYVDHYGVGMPSGMTIPGVDRPRFRAQAEALLQSLGKSYLIKKSLREV